MTAVPSDRPSATLRPEAPQVVWVEFPESELDATRWDTSRASIHFGRQVPDPDTLARVTFYCPAVGHSTAAGDLSAAMTALRWVQLPSVGYERALAHLPAEIGVCNAAGVNSTATAELALGHLLMGMRQCADFQRDQAEHRWRRDADGGATVSGSLVGIVGAGSIGGAIAEKVRLLGGDVLQFARTAWTGVHAMSDLDRALPTLDALVVAVPATPDTHHLLDRDRLTRLRDGALIVNVGRGSAVDTAALVPELASGRLRAGLDVVEEEPLPPESVLWDLPGLSITPHIGGAAADVRHSLRQLLSDQIGRYLGRLELRNVVRRPRP